MSNELTTLSTLAVEINLLNEQVEHHKNQAVIYAARTGVKLNEVKEGLGNNTAKFVEWLKNNCTVKKSNAYNYIRLSKEMPQLLDSSFQSTGMPNLTQAIELLSAPEEIREEVTARIESGEDVTIKEIQRLKKEAAEAQQKAESLQNDLIAKTQAITEKEKRINWLEVDKKAITEQNDQLRNDLAFKIDERANEKLELERAKLILENQQAIEKAKQQAETAALELEKLKKEQAKQIELGVKRELQSFDTEISKKQQQIQSYNRDIEKLREVENSLEREVGYLQTHKKAIERIKDNLSFLTVSFSDAFDTNIIPNEVFTEWQSISYALSQINKQMLDFIREKSPLESNAIIGELVN